MTPAFTLAEKACGISDLLTTVAKGKPRDANAVRVLRWAVHLDEHNGTAWNNLGRCYLEQKRWLNALDCFAAAARELPGDALRR